MGCLGRAGEGDRRRTRVPGDHGVAPCALSSTLSFAAVAAVVAPAVRGLLGLDGCHSERDQCIPGSLPLGIVLWFLSGCPARALRTPADPTTTTRRFPTGVSRRKPRWENAVGTGTAGQNRASSDALLDKGALKRDTLGW